MTSETSVIANEINCDIKNKKLIEQLTASIAHSVKQQNSSAIKVALTLLLGALEKGEISIPLTASLAEKLQSQGVASTADFTPMIISGERLFLARYYHYHRLLNNHLVALAKREAPAFESDKMKIVLDKLFPLDSKLIANGTKNWQKVAASLALHKSLAVISGGPGTGKTTTVLKLLAVLLEAQSENGRALQVRLAAPTGKAAARMQESIRGNIAQLICDETIKSKLQALKASTLHRLLGYKHNSVDFRFNAANPLALDVLVVDESSMIDTTMMAKLLDAMPEHARIILLGDKDQLPPVDPGSPFADICSQFGFSNDFSLKLENLSGEDLSEVQASDKTLSDNLIFLKHSYRFDAKSGIGHLAGAINNSDLESAVTLLDNPDYEDINWVDYKASQFRKQDLKAQDPIIKKIKQGFSGYKNALKENASFNKINQAFLQFCVLTCIRQGPSGLDVINEIAKEALGFVTNEFWYHGRPIMVTRNDYQTKLYNGDVGLCLDLEGKGELRVYFPTVEGYRTMNPSRIPDHETAFTMTVHKSQGSEFTEVLFVLPEKELPIMSKQLIYTAITRAKKSIEIWGDKLTIYKEK